jgi:hypothetical protein
MYIFPIDEKETDFVDVKADSVTLKTYGLPVIFWVYLAGILIVLFSMWLSTKNVLGKLLTFDDLLLVTMYWMTKIILLVVPVVLIGFFFYEKQIKKSKDQLTITHKLFFIPFYKKTLTLDSSTAFTVDHFLDSPNIAKMKSRPALRGFENKGYFELHALANGKSIRIDRHSTKPALVKMVELLSRY